MPWHVFASHWSEISCVHALCNIWVSKGRRGSLWTKGDLHDSSVPFLYLGHQGMGVQIQPPSLAVSRLRKYCLLPFTGAVLTVRTLTDKAGYLYDSYTSVGCCCPPFVQRPTWQLPSYRLEESLEWTSALIKLFFSSSPQQIFESWGDDN